MREKLYPDDMPLIEKLRIWYAHSYELDMICGGLHENTPLLKEAADALDAANARIEVLVAEKAQKQMCIDNLKPQLKELEEKAKQDSDTMIILNNIRKELEGRLAEEVNCKRILLLAVQLAYRKHHMNDGSVGWEELSDNMCNALCEVMTDKGFQDWLSRVGEGK